MAIDVVEQMDGSTGSNYATENVEPHEIVTDTIGTGVELADGDEAYEDFKIALGPKHAPWIHEDDSDTSNLEYDGSDATLENNDRVPYAPLRDGMVVYCLTVTETNSGVTSSPSIDEHDIVGVPDTTNADAPSDPGRIVQEGYSNDENDDASSTTFNRSNNNFIAIGRALPSGLGQLAADSFGDVVRVEIVAGLN